MIEQLKTIREKAEFLCYQAHSPFMRESGQTILTALNQLEAMVGEPGVWRPISTAPRDGTNILLRFGQDGVSQGKFVRSATGYPWKFTDSNDGITWLTNHAVDGPGGPSHWMPMPDAAPVAQQPHQCALCGSDEAFTGACGGGKNNPRALCYEPVTQQPQAECAMCGGMGYIDGIGNRCGLCDGTGRQPQAEAVPPGYVLVPVEPTDEMIQGFWGDITHGELEREAAKEAWRKAIDAAIAAQGEKHAF